VPNLGLAATQIKAAPVPQNVRSPCWLRASPIASPFIWLPPSTCFVRWGVAFSFVFLSLSHPLLGGVTPCTWVSWFSVLGSFCIEYVATKLTAAASRRASPPLPRRTAVPAHRPLPTFATQAHPWQAAHRPCRLLVRPPRGVPWRADVDIERHALHAHGTPPLRAFSRRAGHATHRGRGGGARAVHRRPVFILRAAGRWCAAASSASWWQRTPRRPRSRQPGAPRRHVVGGPLCRAASTKARAQAHDELAAHVHAVPRPLLGCQVTRLRSPRSVLPAAVRALAGAARWTPARHAAVRGAATGSTTTGRHDGTVWPR